MSPLTLLATAPVSPPSSGNTIDGAALIGFFVAVGFLIWLCTPRGK